MRFDVISIFPALFAAPLSVGVVGRARAGGHIDLQVHDLRDFADPPRRSVDDDVYGGGAGMVFRPEPIVRAAAAVRRPEWRAAVVLPTPAGEVLTQALARELGEYEQVVILCDRYEGSDARVASLVSHEVSIGDFVLTGGELAALVLIDAVARTVAGVVGDETSVARDSFASTLLDHRAFTRPLAYRGQAVPEVVVSGHHGAVAGWRRRDSVRRTLERRPDLLDGIPLPPAERALVAAERGLSAKSADETMKVGARLLTARP